MVGGLRRFPEEIVAGAGLIAFGNSQRLVTNLSRRDAPRSCRRMLPDLPFAELVARADGLVGVRLAAVDEASPTCSRALDGVLPRAASLARQLSCYAGLQSFCEPKSFLRPVGSGQFQEGTGTR